MRGGGALVATISERYRELIDDPASSHCCHFTNASARSCAVRCTPCAAPNAFERSPQRYLRYAARFEWRPHQPFIVVTCGLTGSGKSSLARQLSERTGAAVIKLGRHTQSDRRPIGPAIRGLRRGNL